MGSTSFTKVASRAIGLAALSFALGGCDVSYKVNATKQQIAALFPSPTGGFAVPTATHTPSGPTATPTRTPTATPTRTPTAAPVATSVRLDFSPNNLVNGFQELPFGRCFPVQVVSRMSNGTEFPVSAMTTFALAANPGLTGSIAGLGAGIFSNATCTTMSNAVTIAMGASRATFWIRGATITDHVLAVNRTAGMMLGTATAPIRFVREYAKLGLLGEVSNAAQIPGGLCYRIRVNSRALDDVVVAPSAAVSIRYFVSPIVTPFAQAGCPAVSEIATSNASPTEKTFVRTIAAGTSGLDLWVKTTVARNDTARFRVEAEPASTAVTGGVLNLTVVPAVTQIRWSIASQPVVAGVCSGIAAHASSSAHVVQPIELRGFALDGLPQDPTTAFTATLTVPAGTTVFTGANCLAQEAVTRVTVGTSGPARVWVRTAAPGNIPIVATADGLGTASFTVAATNGPSGSRYKTPFPAVAVTECSEPLEIELVNSAGTATAANAAGGGDASLTIAGLPPGSAIYRDSDSSCNGAALASVAVPSASSAARFRIRAALTNPPSYNLALAVTQGPLPTAASASLALERRDLETDRACLNEARERAGFNTFRMLTNHDEVAYTTLRLPNGKFLVAGDSSEPPGDATPAIPHGAIAIIDVDCRLSTMPSFFATNTGHHVMMSSVLYPEIGASGTGIRKLIAVDETPNPQTGVASFYALGFANRNGRKDVFVARFRGDGTLDNTFGESTGILPPGSSVPIKRGWLTVDLGLDDEALDGAIIGNRLVVVANSNRGNQGRVWLLLFDNLGVEAGSRAAIQFQNTKVDYGGFATLTEGSDQYVLVGATLTTLMDGEPVSADWFVSKNRLTVDGFAGQPSSPPVNFGSQIVGDDDRLAAIAVQTVMVNGAPRAGVVMAGTTAQGPAENSQTEAAFARLRLPGLALDINQGSQDPNEYFQNNGKLFLEAIRNQTLSSLALDSLGRVLGFGRDADTAQNSRPYVARVKSNGDPTPVSTKVSNTFAFGGTRDAFYGAVRRPDNKMFAVGATGVALRRQFLVTILLE